MRDYLGSFWKHIYGEEDPQSSFIEALQRCFANEEMNTVSQIEHTNRALSRTSVEPYVRTMARKVSYTEKTLNDQHYIFDGTLTFNGAEYFNSKPSDIFRLPLPSNLKDPIIIADDPVNPTLILQAGIDFMYQDDHIYMREDIRHKGFELSFNDAVPPQPMLDLWFINSKTSFDTIQRLFGDPIQAASFDSPELINIYWDMLIEGCSERNIKRLLCFLTDTDYVDEGGTVEKIFSENNRICVIIGDAVITAPEAAGILVSEGDEVKAGQFIFGNANIYTYSDKIPPDLFPIMHLSEAMIGSDINGGVSIENIESFVPELRQMFLLENVTMEAVDDKVEGDRAYIVSTSDDFEIIQFDKEPYIKYKIVRIYEPFPFCGTRENVLKFLYKLNKASIEHNSNLLDIIDKEAAVDNAKEYNLFELYRSSLFGTNAVFMSIKTELAPPGVDLSVSLTFLKRVLNAGTSILTFFDSESIVEYSLGDVSDSVSTFLVPDTLIDTFDNVADTLNAG